MEQQSVSSAREIRSIKCPNSQVVEHIQVLGYALNNNYYRYEWDETSVKSRNKYFFIYNIGLRVTGISDTASNNISSQNS